MDSTIVRAHQHAVGVRKQGVPAGEPDDHTIGRSRGGPATKIHLVADGRCRPPALVLTAGQAGHAPAFEQVMARLRVPRQRGRPRTTPDDEHRICDVSSRYPCSCLPSSAAAGVQQAPVQRAAHRDRTAGTDLLHERQPCPAWPRQMLRGDHNTTLLSSDDHTRRRRAAHAVEGMGQ